MEQIEIEFYNDIKNALSPWNCSLSYYHDSNYGGKYFCVDITVEEIDADMDKIWYTLEEVTGDWHAGLDHSMNEFYVALNIND